MRRPAIPLADRLWAKVDKSGGEDACWLWTGVVNNTGYGQIFTGVDKPGHQKMMLVHRAAMIVSGVVIPPGMEVDHLCKVIRCCNPKHLRVATPRQNSVENGTGPWAMNAKKTRCNHGHPFEGDNLAIIRQHNILTRVCITCTPSLWYRCVVPRELPACIRYPRNKVWLGPEATK